MNRRAAPKGKTDSYGLIVFDVDGVLVDVRESYQRTVLETIGKITGKRASRRELHEWKNRAGFNDDWKLTHAWARALGSKLDYQEVKKQFEAIYWGNHNGSGNILRERWLLTKPQMQRLANRFELAMFTGRTRHELDHMLERFDARRFFRRIVTVEDVAKPKPDPEGLLQVLAGRPASGALYVGDNVDDAAAARAASMDFVGILAVRSEERRIRATRLKELGALTILGVASEVERWVDEARRSRV